ERSADLSAEVVLAQARSLVADLLAVTGMEPLAATDQIPPL
ncbi:MAG: putative rane protein YgaE, family, partial [Marmoricola sp.]|nr:putative rane protein YgaE, family [Marmoricola sp.]